MAEALTTTDAQTTNALAEAVTTEYDIVNVAQALKECHDLGGAVDQTVRPERITVGRTTLYLDDLQRGETRAGVPIVELTYIHPDGEEYDWQVRVVVDTERVPDGMLRAAVALLDE